MKLSPKIPMQPASQRPGFTLIELLVVCGIIALLIAIAVPATLRARRIATAQSTKAQLGNIATALETYASNFDGYYPPSTLAGNGFNSFPAGNFSASARGAQLLAQALMGWMPAAYDGGGTPGDPSDFGFRTKNIGVNAVGSLYGPYMPNSPKVYDAANHVFVDSSGNPIYYFLSVPQAKAGTFYAPSSVFGTAANGMYVTADNSGTPTDSGFLKLLGNASGNNTIASGDNINPKKYLLIAPDPSGNYFNGDNLINESR